MFDRPLPEGRFVFLPGRGETFVRVHQASPEAPTLVLLHGWTASADLDWLPAYRPLAARTSFVAIDHRGHGRGCARGVASPSRRWPTTPPTRPAGQGRVNT